MLIIIAIIIAYLVLVYSLFAFALIYAYGWFITEVELSELLTACLDQAKLASGRRSHGNFLYFYDHERFLNDQYPFIARVGLNVLGAKYYIDDVGIIPPWSKWNKAIDAKIKELRNKGV